MIFKRKKGQGSLEYLIIIAAVLAIAAVVVLYLSGVLGGTAASYSQCRLKASECRAMQTAGPFNCHDMCDAACVDSYDYDIKSGDISATACVKEYQDPVSLDYSACGLCMNGTIDGIEPL